MPLTTFSAELPEMDVEIRKYWHQVRSMCLQEDGKLIIGGLFNRVAGVERFHLARFNADGTFDPAWHPKIDIATEYPEAGIVDMAIQDGFLYVCGVFTGVNGVGAESLAKISLQDSGSLNALWKSGVSGEVAGLEIAKDGLLVHGPSIGLRKLSFETGAIISEWNPEPDGPVWGMSVMETNVYIAGRFTYVGGAQKNYLAKLSTTGSGQADKHWTNSGDYRGVTKILLKATEAGLLAGGEGGSFSGGRGFAQFDKDDGHILHLDVEFRDVTAIETHGTNIYVAFGGNSTEYTHMYFVSRMNTSDYSWDANWKPFLLGRLLDFHVNGRVSAIVFRGNDIYLGGDFLSAGASGGSGVALIPTIEGTPRITEATTLIGRQSTSGLQIRPDPLDYQESNYYQIIFENGVLLKSDGLSRINQGEFISRAEAQIGLRFRPDPGFFGQARFTVQAASRPVFEALGGLKGEGRINVLTNRLTQTIVFPEIADRRFRPGDLNEVELSAEASSGAPVTYRLISRNATLSGSRLKIAAPGLVEVEATQPGDGLYDAAPAVRRRFTVQKAEQRIVVTAPETVEFSSKAVPLKIEATSHLPVHLVFLGGSASYDTNGLHLMGVGTITLQFEQSGDAVYEKTQERFTINVVKARQTIDFPVPGDVEHAGGTISLSATASSGLPVSFQIVDGPALLHGNIVDVLHAGRITVRASQDGDATYSAAPLVERSFNAGPLTQSISLEAVEIKYQNEPIVLTARASSGLPVAYEVLQGPGLVAGDKLTVTNVGVLRLRIIQTGNSDYAPVALEQELAIIKGPQVITFLSDRTTPLSEGMIPLDAVASSGLPVFFTVVSGPAVVDERSLIPTGIGTVVLRLSQPGDSRYEAAPDLDIAYTISPPRPINDDLAARIALSSQTDSGFATANNEWGTREPGEPLISSESTGATVWFSWEAAARGRLLLSTSESEVPTTLAAFTGDTVSSLERVDNDGASLDSLSLNVRPGILYNVAIDGRSGRTGNIRLAFTFEKISPELAFERIGQMLVLLWPAALSDFELEVAPTASGPWSKAITQPGPNGKVQILLNEMNRSRFYRMASHPSI